MENIVSAGLTFKSPGSSHAKILKLVSSDDIGQWKLMQVAAFHVPTFLRFFRSVVQQTT